MATSFQLPTWTNPPNDTNTSDRARLITKNLSVMQAQMKAIAAEASKWTTRGRSAKSSHQDIKDSGKLPKPKSKQAAQDSQDDQSAEVEFLLDDLKGAFDAMLNTGNQESSQSQQEMSKPSDPDASKSDQKALRPPSLDSNPSHQEALKPASLDVSQSPSVLDTSYGNGSI